MDGSFTKFHQQKWVNPLTGEFIWNELVFVSIACVYETLFEAFVRNIEIFIKVSIESSALEPCADVIASAAARRSILVGARHQSKKTAWAVKFSNFAYLF